MSDTETKAEAPRVAGKSLSAMTGGAKIQAIVPTSIGEAVALAKMIYEAGLAPASIDSAPKLCIVIMKGLEIGMGPMAAMESIGIINGRAALYGDGIPMLLWSNGFKIREWYEGDHVENMTAHCEITRPSGDKYTFSYSSEDARENGLWLPDGGNKPWSRYKRRMLRMRCRGWLARDCASDVLKGCPIYEEVADMVDVTPGAPAGLPAPVGANLDLPDDISLDVPDAISEAEDNQDAPLANPDAYAAQIKDNLTGATTEEEWDEIWEAHEELVEAGRLPGNFAVELEQWAGKSRARFEIPPPRKGKK